ncbi:unnamed protein product [Ceratitis capitata]|uniref:(Mediterranean fruit fly) hypothetical protein n=1 Tax=Ceratitis capitata TaxID=7213 RepID=A0A811V4G7_CERCA|nr:unnamed protein product [Ceratitis capitata]
MNRSINYLIFINFSKLKYYLSGGPENLIFEYLVNHLDARNMVTLAVTVSANHSLPATAQRKQRESSSSLFRLSSFAPNDFQREPSVEHSEGEANYRTQIFQLDIFYVGE